MTLSEFWEWKIFKYLSLLPGSTFSSWPSFSFWAMEVKFDRMKFHWNFIDEISRNFTEISSCLKWTMKFHRYVNLYFLWYLLHLTTSVSVDHQFGQICQLLCLFGPFWDSGIDRHNLPQLKDIFTNSPRESLKTSLQL